MGRTVIRRQCNDVRGSMNMAMVMLQQAGYVQKLVNNEPVWQKGVGIMTLRKFIKVEAQGNMVFIAGWVKGFTGMEGELRGAYGALPKQQVKGLMNDIAAAMR